MLVVETVYRIFSVALWLCLVAAIFYGLHAVYYAYFKTKDERQQHIVLRSAAAAFGVVLAYYLLEAVVQFADYGGRGPIGWVWQFLHFGIDFMPAAAMTATLGICLFINKRRAGGG